MSWLDEQGIPAKYANVLVIGAQTQECIAAVTGKKLRVLALHAHETIATNQALIFQDDSGTPVQLFGGTGATLAMSIAGLIGPPTITLPYNERGWFETTAGQALDVVAAGTNCDLTILIVYAEV